jgi:uncharacterized FlgJ-related protein
MLDAARTNAVAQSLVTIAQDANLGAVQDPELFRRLDLIIDTFLATPAMEESALARARLARALQDKCDGPGCDRLVAHILRGD